MQFPTGRNVPLVVAVLVNDEKVVHLRGDQDVIVGNLGQQFFQFAGELVSGECVIKRS